MLHVVDPVLTGGIAGHNESVIFCHAFIEQRKQHVILAFIPDALVYIVDYQERCALVWTKPLLPIEPQRETARVRAGELSNGYLMLDKSICDAPCEKRFAGTRWTTDPNVLIVLVPISSDKPDSWIALNVWLTRLFERSIGSHRW